MDFFTQQETAHRRTRRWLVLYLVAILAIIAALDLSLAVIMALVDDGTARGQASPVQWARANPGPLFAVAAGVILVISLATLYKTLSLRAGGGRVAADLGGTRVAADHADRRVRQLVNVVEEMAIAAGLPVPEVYVLEQEAGINAFAAGYTPADAAVAVTRGVLEAFDREELQGVVGHELSHILNGDMRLNMRLLGPLFGLLLISMMGRILLRSVRYGRSRGDRTRGNAVAVVMLLGLSLAVVGWLGQLAARLIKAGISRQREFLADASAVQFTRQTEGIAGALRKIAAWHHGSAIIADEAEEIGHMLFADGVLRHLQGWFATHPPLDERLRRLGETPPLSVAAPAGERSTASLALVGDSGPADQRDGDRPPLADEVLYTAARQARRVRELLLALVLDPEPVGRGEQLVRLKAMPADLDLAWAQAIYPRVTKLDRDGYLPLFDLAFPTLRRLDHARQLEFLGVLDTLGGMDGQVDSFEYLLSRLLRQTLAESQSPVWRGELRRGPKLQQLREELVTVFSMLAGLGHAGQEAAERAYRAGMNHLLGLVEIPAYRPGGLVPRALDTALQRLDTLRPTIKREILRSLHEVVSFDGRRVAAELELLRVIAALLHCPLSADYRWIGLGGMISPVDGS